MVKNLTTNQVFWVDGAIKRTTIPLLFDSWLVLPIWFLIALLALPTLGLSLLWAKWYEKKSLRTCKDALKPYIQSV